jgi:exocyst complex component 7
VKFKLIVECQSWSSFLSILRVECSRRTTEAVIKRWSTVTKVVERAVTAMRRQLYAQSPGAFDGFRDEYLLALTESRVLVLLKFADEFTRLTSHEKLLYILSMYEALSDAAPGLLLLFSGARKQRVSERTQGILTKLGGVVRTMASGLLAKIQSDSSQTPSPSDGVHPLTRRAMARVEQLAPHRTVLGVILASAGGERATTFGGLVAELIGALERNLEEKSAHISAGGSASPHLFLANNTSFVLTRAADADVASLLGDGWAARRRSQVDRHGASYVEACWGPVVACLELPGGPARALAKFNAAFKRVHGSQVCRAVPDPALRAALRTAVWEKVVPAYAAFLQKHPKLVKSARYSADNLTECSSDLFEGEGADSRKS